MYTFSLSDNQQKKLDAWLKEVYAKTINMQKAMIEETHEFYHLYKESWDLGYPYTGAIGGNISYTFTPTSLGATLVVHESASMESIDLTEYDLW